MESKNKQFTLQLREIHREMGRRELKPTYLELSLEQEKLSGAARTRLLQEKKKVAGQANTDTGIKQRPEQAASTSEGSTGAGSGTTKRTKNCSGMPTSAEKQPTKRCRTIPEMS